MSETPSGGPRSSQESASDEAWGWAEIQRQFARLDELPDHGSLPIGDKSPFGVDAEIENYDRPADQVLFLIGVATDHLDTFRRMLLDPNGGLPSFAGYTLLRAAIEAAGTALWLRMPGTANARVARSLWLIVRGRDEVEGLATRLGVNNAKGYARMRARVDGIIASRKGLRPGILERRHTKTSILSQVNQRVKGRFLTPLEAWQACSGLTHSNRTSALMFLEREVVAIEGTRAMYRVTASARITAEMLWITTEVLAEVSRTYVEHCQD